MATLKASHTLVIWTTQKLLNNYVLEHILCFR